MSKESEQAKKTALAILAGLTASAAAYGYGVAKGRWALDVFLAHPEVPPEGPAIAILKLQEEMGPVYSFAAAAAEEVIFRGLLLEAVAAAGYPKVGLGVSSAVFGFTHGGNLNRKIDATAGGAVYGSVYLIGREAHGPLLGILLSAVAHWAHNMGTAHGGIQRAREVAAERNVPETLPPSIADAVRAWRD